MELFEGKVLNEYSKMTEKSSLIKPEWYSKYEVKRGLRDLDGKGVLVGLTEIGEIQAYMMEEGKRVPGPGQLIYRGYDINDLVKGFSGEHCNRFEETAYLLLFGQLPDQNAQKDFQQLLALYQNLPEEFARKMILNAPSKDIMKCAGKKCFSVVLL